MLHPKSPHFYKNDLASFEATRSEWAGLYGAKRDEWRREDEEGRELHKAY